jgi:hypothetical protein
MDCTIKINMDNAAFEGSDASVELARILRDLSKRVYASTLEQNDTDFHIPLMDINGNHVGDITID